MAIRLPRYEEIPRQPIGPTTPTYQRVGERFMSQYRYAERQADIQQRSIDVSRKYGNIQFGLNLVQAGTQFVVSVAQFANTVMQAQATSQVNDASMETEKGFVDLMAELEGLPAIPEEFLNTQSVLADIEPAPDFQQYYQYRADQLYNELSERYGKELRNPVARQQYQNFLNSYYGKAYGDFTTAGLDRDARVATSTAYKNLREAVDLGDWKMAEAIIDTNVSTGVWSPEQGERLREIVPGIKLDNAIAHARRMGERGPDYLMSETAREMFEITPEQGEAGAMKLATELANKKKAEELRDFPKRKETFETVLDMIKSGEITSVDQLQAGEMRELVRSRSNGNFLMYDEDYTKVEQILNAQAEAWQEDRESYSDDMLKIVDDAIEVGDTQTASRILQELVSGNYHLDARGRLDPEYRRYAEQLRRVSTGEDITPFDREANRLWSRLRDIDLVGFEDDLGDFLEQFPNKEGREEHQQLLNEFQEISRQQATKGQGESKARLDADYNEHFWMIYNSKGVDIDELQKLDRWRYDNYPNNALNPELPGIDESTWVSMGKLITSKIELLEKEASALRTKMIDLGEDRIDFFFEPQLNNYRGVTDKNNLRKLAELQDTYTRSKLEYYEAMKVEDADPIEEATRIISEAAGVEIETQFGPEYKRDTGVDMPITGEEALREYALGSSPLRGGAATVPEPSEEIPPTFSFRGETYYNVPTDAQRNIAEARKTITGFGRFAKDENGMLIITRNKQTGELALIDATTRQLVKTDEGRLAEFARAYALLKRYE